MLAFPRPRDRSVNRAKAVRLVRTRRTQALSSEFAVSLLTHSLPSLPELRSATLAKRERPDAHLGRERERWPLADMHTRDRDDDEPSASRTLKLRPDRVPRAH